MSFAQASSTAFCSIKSHASTYSIVEDNWRWPRARISKRTKSPRAEIVVTKERRPLDDHVFNFTSLNELNGIIASDWHCRLSHQSQQAYKNRIDHLPC